MPFTNINTTQAQQKALDDALVALADRLEFWKCNMRLETDIKPKEATFQATVSIHRSSIRFPINKKKVSLDVDIFRDILQDLGHTRDITYLTDVNVHYLHQPWRAFATIINKCLSGKETRMDKIRLSHLLFQIEYKDAKKTNNMSYPRFTKIIIDYFMSKNPSISRRNKMFWHTSRDDTMFTSMRCNSRHEDTQRRLQNQSIFKRKPIQTHKGTRLKSKEKVAKPDKKKQPAKKTKPKGLDVLSEVALTEAEQIKLATKRSKKYFHVSHASGSGDAVDTQSKVLDEKQQNTFGTDEGTDSKDKDNNDDNGDSDDHDDDNDDKRTESDRDDILDPKLTNVDQTEHEEEEYDDEFYEEEEEEENIDDEETMYDEEDDEVTKELYDDV
ncbi:hypothetical protein Tco_1225510, partial [Tanacetum coccineum]